MAGHFCFLQCLGIVLFIVFRLKYNLHMLQLNSYRTERFITFLKRNRKKIIDIDFIFSFAFLIIGFFRNDLWLNIGVTILIIISAFSGEKPQKAKKEFVVTSRVKRQIATISLIFAAFSVLCIVFAFNNILAVKILTLIFGLFALMPYIVVLLANIINSPIEKAVAKYYINDAKKIIATSNAKVIGITGSYGKTTTKYILETLLSQKYNVLKTPGNLNTTLGVTRTIREMLLPTHNIFICEMGAKQKGDIKEICDIVKPQLAVISSIGYQHLETFKNIDNIINTKFELVNALPDKSVAFLNGDNEFIRSYKDVKNPFYFGINTENDGYCKDISYNENGAKFTFVSKDIEIPIETSLLGYNNIINIAGACAVALNLGVEKDDIQYAVSLLKAPEHRLSILRKNSNLTIIDDAYNSNPMGSACALDVLKGFKNRRIVITPGMIELGERQYEENFILGQNAAKSCDLVVLVGKKQTQPIFDGLKNENYNEENIMFVESVTDAFKIMYDISKDEPCTVLIENDLTDDYL